MSINADDNDTNKEITASFAIPVGLGKPPFFLISIPILIIVLTALILRLGLYPIIPGSSPDNIQQENEIGWFLIQFGRKLEIIVFTDSLTGVINRNPFMDLLEQNINRAKREKTKLALLFLEA